MIQTIDGAAYKRMVISAAAAVELQKQQINDLNVFPVPDGDTGTNMSMTLNSSVTDLAGAAAPDLETASKITASALLRGARGNSGVILSLLFRGFSKTLKGRTECDGTLFAEALTSGVEVAYKAVMHPAEGTILTVSRVTAAAAKEEAENDPGIEHILEYSVGVCREAVAKTIDQNPVLKKAGVVDAGGQGFLIVLEGMLASVQGNDIVAEAAPEAEETVFTTLQEEEITFAFDTVYIVRKATEDIDLLPLRDYLGSIGDSLVISEDDEIFKVHVHTNIPGEALTESQKYGTLELAKIENMRTQRDELAAGRKAQSTDDLDKIEEEMEAAPSEPPKPIGVVTVCAGEGISDVFRELGVDRVISGGQTMNPSTEDILEQIKHVNAETVFVLPNNKNIILAAQQAAELAEQNVVVIESKTVPQGITAMLNFSPDLSVDELREVMTESLSGVTTMLITYAARDSDFDDYEIHEGDYMALYNGSLVGTDKSLPTLIMTLAELVRMDNREFINIYYGADIDEAQAQEVADCFKELCGGADINLINGGQPVYYYMISAE
ncbi:MAG: DAK2 domain-containing protein [Oscillospiraceae bacterium]|nr:DAK2 domain-containing protein [Oscillospiraceae bacterium]